jgi:hypothetical protein
MSSSSGMSSMVAMNERKRMEWKVMRGEAVFTTG